MTGGPTEWERGHIGVEAWRSTDAAVFTGFYWHIHISHSVPAMAVLAHYPQFIQFIIYRSPPSCGNTATAPMLMWECARGTCVFSLVWGSNNIPSIHSHSCVSFMGTQINKHNIFCKISHGQWELCKFSFCIKQQKSWLDVVCPCDMAMTMCCPTAHGYTWLCRV